MSRLWRTAKGQLVLVFGLLLALSVPAAGGAAVLPSLAAAVVSACVLDGACMWLEGGRPRVPASALLTALIVFFILAPSESPLVVAWTCGFAIAAKRLIRTQREHIFNPAALALLWAPLAFGSGESWWGALSELPWFWTLVMVVAGVVLVERLNKLPMVLVFLACYFSVFTFVSLGQPQAVAEMFRAPFVQSALFLALFMLTDPPTSPSRYADQVWFGVLAAVAACVAQLFGAGQTYLLLGVLVANIGLAVVRAWRRRGVATVALSTA
jgi:enediyne biosynthesis protein E5